MPIKKIKIKTVRKEAPERTQKHVRNKCVSPYAQRIHT